MRNKNKNEALANSFSHIYATGITTLVTVEELIKTYSQRMRKDLEHDGIQVSDEEIKSYLAKTYDSLEQLKKRHGHNVKCSF